MLIGWLNSFKLLAFVSMIFSSNVAYAYIGPAMGAGAFITALVFIGIAVTAILILIYLPIKRFLKKKNK